MDNLKLKIFLYFSDYYNQFGADGISASGKPYIQLIKDDVDNFPPHTFSGSSYILLDIAGNGNVKGVRRVSSIAPID